MVGIVIQSVLSSSPNKALKRDLARVAFSICVVFSG